MSQSNQAFAAFAILAVTGFALAWLPLGLLAAATIALLVSVALARSASED